MGVTEHALETAKDEADLASVLVSLLNCCDAAPVVQARKEDTIVLTKKGITALARKASTCLLSLWIRFIDSSAVINSRNSWLMRGV